MIFTSYYAGEIRGEAVAISLYPPKGFQGRHLPLFAPTPELLKWWKSSVKDATTQQEYKRQFREILDSRQQLIDLWVRKQRESSADITLCCFEKTGDFCHRHIVGREVIERSLPQLWGGEVNSNPANYRDSVAASASELICLKQRNSLEVHKQSMTPETETGEFTSSQSLSQLPVTKDSLSRTTTESITTKSIKSKDFPDVPNATYQPTIVNLLSKCHQAGYPVRCERTECGYYRVSVHSEDLGEWSELGLLGVLSGLRQEFYRQRLLTTLANTASAEVAVPLPIAQKLESLELIMKLSKLEECKKMEQLSLR
ncbi:DUF488 domain-containing protein [Komarekiella delphini-convector]|uniref:DUF488 domain-containing protein n=1 Tax=Komarekiella delphini-convector TaxID=3050158 RepID=UPI001CD90C38|nr:DUF488 domain-containing protein [Komarekiella delphini-convector]